MKNEELDSLFISHFVSKTVQDLNFSFIQQSNSNILQSVSKQRYDQDIEVFPCSEDQE